ncbi:hypothetical protein C8F04DRAFT_1241780 [Mycena alexandri]|uniref:Uncharacterized protein n=1 Tax=Mycena alexandri TaxID=1745969 RepID=A0AAD6S549_9AGAR|nr:hypothetical protein C8F04DRAFT_1241780 [Mycena alexandri]
MWTLMSLLFLPLVAATQANYTIDDASPLVTYRGIVDRNVTGFDVGRLNNQTVTFIAPTPNDSPTISMNFTGSAIYVFVAYPSGHNESFTSGFSARIDGVAYGGWALANTAPLYNHLAYQNTTMDNGLHNFVMQIQPEWELYFDYAVYTSGDADPSSVPPIASPTGSATPPVSPPSGHKKIPVGVVVGSVIGAVVLALISIIFILRRRATVKRKPNPYLETPDHRNIPLDKEVASPTLIPFPLELPPPTHLKGKHTLTLGVPNPASPMSGAEPSPLSATSDPALGLMAEEMRRIRTSVQRLERGLPEARDGGSMVQRPPPYGNIGPR